MDITNIVKMPQKLVYFFKRAIFSWNIKLVAKSVGHELHVNHFSKVTRRTVLGNNVNFNGMNIGGGGNITIGDNFHSGIECMMITSNHNYEGNTIPYDDSFVDKDIIIEDNVWIGNRVIILGGVRIGEGAIIQAGSVVVSDIPPCSIAGGHPARVFKKRDEEHYYKLKELKRYL